MAGGAELEELGHEPARFADDPTTVRTGAALEEEFESLGGTPDE